MKIRLHTAGKSYVEDQKVKGRALDPSAEVLIGVSGTYEQYQEYMKKRKEPYYEWKSEWYEREGEAANLSRDLLSRGSERRC
jgi:hypothetical protein